MADAAAIRIAGSADAARLSELGRRTFEDAFGADNRPEDLAAYLDATYTVERQAAELRDPRWITLLAEVGAELAAYAQLREMPAPACVSGPDPIELARFYVDRRWHGQGLAGRLMDRVIAAAEGRGARTLWLGVWQRNPRAIAFYRRSGFRAVGEQVFRVGADPQTDWVMARPLGALSRQPPGL